MGLIGIVDDHEKDMVRLKNLILKNPDCPDDARLRLYTCGEDLLKDLNEPFNVIFLDVRLKGMDGEKTASEIRRIDQDVVLVFYTGFADPTVESIKLLPYRYLKKSMRDEELQKEITAVLKEMARRETIPALWCRLHGTRLLVNARDIVYLTIHNKRIKVVLKKDRLDRYGIEAEGNGEQPLILCNEKLKDIYMRFGPYGFEFVQHSYLINLLYIVQKDGEWLELEDDHRLSISRSKAAALREHWSRYLREKYHWR